MRRVIAVALVGILAIAGLSAMGGGDGDGAEDQVLRFSVYQPQFGTSWTETEVYPAMMEKFEDYIGMPIEIEWEEVGWNDFNERSAIYWAAGDYADVFTGLDWNSIQQAGDSGLIVDLMDYDIPYYTENYLNLGANRSIAVNPDGELFGFVSSVIQNNTGTQSGWAYRHDVFEEAGLALPETMDQFLAAARRLKELYPDSYPITGRPGTDETLNVLTALLTHNRTYNRIAFNGTEFVFGPVQDRERFREVVEFLALLYEEELLDPEFVNHTNEQIFAKMIDGTSFMSPAFFSGRIERDLNTNAQFDGRWVVPERPSNFRGEVGWKQGSGFVGAILQDWTAIVVSSQAPQIDQIVKLIDYQHSPEIVELGSWGWEGVSFRYNPDGSRSFVDSVLEMDDAERREQFIQWGIYPALSTRPGFTFFPQDRDATAFFNQTYVWDGDGVRWDNYWFFTSAVEGPESVWPEDAGYRPATTFTTDERDLITNTMTPIYTYVDETVARLIVGQLPMSEYDDFVDRIDSLGDWRRVVDLYNSKL